MTRPPCIKDQCRSPVACSGFGHCRELNFESTWTIVHDYVALLKAIDHTLSVHGHIDANTPLHERVQRTLAVTSQGREGAAE